MILPTLLATWGPCVSEKLLVMEFSCYPSLVRYLDGVCGTVQCTCSCQPACTIFALIFPCITTKGGRSRHNLRHRAIDALPKEFYTEHGAAENIKLWLCKQVVQRKIHTTIL